MVVCVCVRPVSSFLAVTVAPGTTAPVASVTVPVTREVPVCAEAWALARERGYTVVVWPDAQGR